MPEMVEAATQSTRSSLLSDLVLISSQQRAPDRQWYLFYDYCMDNCYGLSVSRDLLHWQPLGDVDRPENTHHSSIVANTEEELAALRSRYGSRSGWPLGLR